MTTGGFDLEDVDGRKISASRSTPSTVHSVGVGSAANALETTNTAASQQIKDLIKRRDGPSPASVTTFSSIIGFAMHESMTFRSALIAFTTCLLLLKALQAQPPAPTPANSPAFIEAKSFDPAMATKAWLDSVPADKRAKSDAYFEGGYWLILWNFLVGAAIAIFLLNSRFSAQLRDFTERVTGSRALQVAIYAPVFIFIVAVLSFPLAFYQFFIREHQYGFATQTFVPWFVEQLVSLGVGLIAGTIALSILYAVFRRAPRSWWIWGTLVVVVLSFIGNFIAPIYVEPLFNTYKPLTDPTIRDPILAMARANEIPVTQVFEVDASRQTTRVSANVAGMLGTTRIALNDNLLKQCSLPEIRAVMAHEMGHYVLNHGITLTL